MKLVVDVVTASQTYGGSQVHSQGYSAVEGQTVILNKSLLISVLDVYCK